MALAKDLSVVAADPVNVWLVIGDKEQQLGPRRRRRLFRRAVPDVWAGPPQARPGDLLLVYLMAPFKQVRYAARVVGEPYRDPKAVIDAKRKVNADQALVPYASLVEVPPVTFQELQDIRGWLNLKGRPRTFLTAETMEKVLALMRERADQVSSDAWQHVVRVPVGDPALPDPATMTFEQWAAIADGPLELEEVVEERIVAPLLRMTFDGVEGFEALRQQRLKGVGIPDWELRRDGQRVGVVEAKLKVAPASSWAKSKPAQQLTRYMHALDVPGMLIDAHRAYLFRSGEAAPSETIDRRTATAADLTAIREHFLEK